ncbi:unnamed protein product, partial [Allacma fusca]
RSESLITERRRDSESSMTVGEDGKETEVLPRCFFDVEIGGLPAGRIVFELFSNVTPKTAENFRALCTGEKGIGKTTEKPLHYKGCVFHRVIKDFMIQGGDFSKGNGSGGESIYGGVFEDENLEVQHDEPFLLSMANRGPATNGSQFFILTQAAPHLNGVHVVFGRVVQGQAIVKQIEALPVDRKSRPLQDVRVTNSGELVLVKKKKEKKPKKEKKKPKEKEQEQSEGSERSSGEISDSSDSGSERKKGKKDKEKKQKTTLEDTQESSNVEVSHPLASETLINADEIPPDPPKRFLSRVQEKEKEKEKEKESTEGTEKKNKTERDRTRSRERERDRGRNRMESKNEHNRDWKRDRDRFAPRYGRNSFSSTGRKIKGRGRVCYRTPSRSRSRSRSKTPPHWKAETRKTITMREYEVKEKARKQREEELRRRQEERQKRHEEQEKEKPESVKGDIEKEDTANTSAEDALGGSPISKTLFETVAEASNADGVVYYQHLYNKGKEARPTESSNTVEKEDSPPSTSNRADTSEEFESIPLLLPNVAPKPPTFIVGTTVTAPGTSEMVEDEEEEMRLRRELLKKRLKEWEDSSDEDKKLKSRTARHTEIDTREKEPLRKRKSSDEDIQTKLMKFSQKGVSGETSREPEPSRRKNKSRSRSRSRRSRDRDRDRRRSRSRGRRDRDRKRRHSSSSSKSRSRSRDRRRRR